MSKSRHCGFRALLATFDAKEHEGHHLMPMKALYGAASLELTERVQLQWHAKIVAIQTEARPAVQSTQPADALHAICAIHKVS